MWRDTPVYLEDLKEIIADQNIPWEKLDGKTVLVTGATGLIGSAIVNALLYYGKTRVLALVRNLEKAHNVFAAQIVECGDRLSFVVGDICAPLTVEESIDYLIHGASQTASKAFVTLPVETIETAIKGTKNMLDIAAKKGVQSVVYLSSMEAYGSPTEEVQLTEAAGAYFDSMSVRSCYPESKRMCEALCAAYTAEYNVPAKVVRLAQTFGPGVSKEDNRVFADFARKALKNEDIIMQTKGNSCRMYLYTMDAVAAIITILLKGENGECYNAANKGTYCSIKEMAELVACTLSEGKSRVLTQINEENLKKYPPAHKLKLDTSKLERLGWQAKMDLAEMYKRMVKGF